MTAWPAGDNGVARQFQSHDWNASPLGPLETWPAALRHAAEYTLAEPMASVLLWGPEYIVAAYNEGYRTILGGEPDVFGRPVLEVWAEERGRLEPQLARALAGETLLFRELPMSLAGVASCDGSWFDYGYGPVRDENGKIAGLIVSILEVTDRVLARRTRRESEERLNVALASANLGTFVWHILEDRTEEDSRARAHFGLPPNGTVSLADALATVFHPEDGPRYAAAVARAMDPAGPGTLHEEFRIRHSSGEERWMSTTAITAFEGSPRKAVRMIGALADVTDRKRADAAMRESEERQAFLLKLSDVLRPLSDPLEVMARASEALGRHLGVGRCGYGEVDPTGELFIVERDWTDGHMVSFRGTHHFVDFGPEFLKVYRAGRSLLIHDALADARADGSEAAFKAAGGVRASLGVPLIKNGRFVAGFFAQQIAPR